MELRPKVICLTPVKNEAWILERFLKLASLWADHIIIADQMSTDGSREIARSFEKVILVDNNSEAFNEPERQKLLITEARKIIGPRLLITLDADECFTTNICISPEWQTILNSKPGTIFKFQWVHFQADLLTMRVDKHQPWGYMDDGAEHEGLKIHSFRIPLPKGNSILELNDIKVIHFQFTDWNRMQSKHRWYMCYEYLNIPNKSAISIYRMYHQMNSYPNDVYKQIPIEWKEDYNKLGIDITSVFCEKKLWWDIQILNWLKEYGNQRFRILAIWKTNWRELAEIHNIPIVEEFRDPRPFAIKILHKYLARTQPYKSNFWVKKVDFFLGLFFKK